MGIWVRAPSLQDGERIAFRRAANHSRGNRAVGGRLFATNMRVIFSPNIVDRLTGQEEWSCRLSDVVSIDTVGRTVSDPFSGGVRRRLSIRTTSGTEDYFVVNHVEAVVTVLAAIREQLTS